MRENRWLHFLCVLMIPTLMITGCAQTSQNTVAQPSFDLSTIAGDYNMTIEGEGDLADAAMKTRQCTLSADGRVTFYYHSKTYFLRYTADDTTLSLYGADGYSRTGTYTISGDELTLSLTDYSNGDGGGPYLKILDYMKAVGQKDDGTLKVTDRWVLVKETSVSDSGSSDGWISYDYDGHGLEVKKTAYDNSGKALNTNVYNYIYDNDGHLILEAGKDGGADGTYKTYDREFSFLGEIKKVTKTEYEKNNISFLTISEYDGGNLIKKTVIHYTGTGAVDYSYEYAYTYDDAGNQIHQTTTRSDGKVFEYDMTYDEHGNPLMKPEPYSQDTSRSVQAYYTYEYDDHDQVISKVEKVTTADGLDYVTTTTCTRDENENVSRIDTVTQGPYSTTATHTLYERMMLSDYLAQKK